MNRLLAWLLGDPDRESRGDPWRITDRRRILVLLREAAEAHAMLRVRINGGPTEYTSMILAVDGVWCRIAIDDPWPKVDRPPLRGGDRLHVSTRLHGVPMHFVLEVEKVLPRAAGPVVQCELPAWVHYRQLRRSYRVLVPPDVDSFRCVIKAMDDRGHRGRLLDLSVEGMGAILLSEAGLRVGDPVSCDLNLEHGSLLAEGELRSLAKVLDRERVGVHFHPLSPADQRLLDREIARLQRLEQARRRLRTGQSMQRNAEHGDDRPES